MKNILILLVFALLVNETSAQNYMTIMDGVIFHDGYAGLVSNPAPPAGVIKHRNDLFARKLTTAELASIGVKLDMMVTISALCDNYDRIGNVNMALVPTGATTYNPNSVKRIEIARFITPFMNKNVEPTSVPYNFSIDNVAMLLKDTTITNKFDIWVELAVFGVPYAANTQVAGCAGRNDVFMGKLEFITDAPSPVQNTNTLIPLYFNNDFNNYQAHATDTLGKTTKTITFDVPKDLSEATLFLITSNHGANQGGEEYNRRFHYAYFDNKLVLTYMPGRATCEPFRHYNTQGNGIYGSTPKTPLQWQSFSNWCPGDVIDIRKINLGAVTAGSHSFRIRVPDAVFVGSEGNIPLSLYLHGTTKTGTVLANEAKFPQDNTFSIYPNPTNGHFTVELLTDNALITVTDLLGKEVLKKQATQKTLHLQLDNSGVYIVRVSTKQGTIAQKLIMAK
jgi:hypothetical protein